MYRASTTPLLIGVDRLLVSLTHSSCATTLVIYGFQTFSLLFGQLQLCSGTFTQIKATVNMHGHGNYLVVVSIPGSMKYKDFHNKAGFIGI